jgi:hypothetical protein
MQINIDDSRRLVEHPFMAGMGQMRSSQLRVCLRRPRSKNSKIADFSDARRPAEDEFCDVLGQECAADVARNPVYEL